MPLDDLHIIPKFRECISYLYIEHARIEQDAAALSCRMPDGCYQLPAASISLLLLGPGTSLSHAAIGVLADCSVLVLWVGEGAIRYYSHGCGATRGAARLLRQVALVSSDQARLAAAARMYRMRFAEAPPEGTRMEQLRGLEGQRVRQAYAAASKASGVPWHGRHYDRSSWMATDPVNRALSAANACLYGLCHAGILALGLSPALGCIHSGKQLSFVYDIADLYKTELTIPLAFREAADGPEELERRVRTACRELFWRKRLLNRIVEDTLSVLADPEPAAAVFAADSDPALPTPLWMPAAEQETGNGSTDP